MINNSDYDFHSVKYTVIVMSSLVISQHSWDAEAGTYQIYYWKQTNRYRGTEVASQKSQYLAFGLTQRYKISHHVA